MNVNKKALGLTLSSCLLIMACDSQVTSKDNTSTIIIAKPVQEFYGTAQPFVKEAIYFVMTDRFVDGDPSNNQIKQGGAWPTFDLPLVGENGETANVGYLGGDLKGVLNNAQYISDMGFTAVWLTPILDNPDQAFSGGEPIDFGGAFKDGGKTGYHGYWANNFYQIDEHYPSNNLGYKEYTQQMRQQFGLKSVFDIVANHGSPSFSMPVDQPKFGELYDIEGKLVADHQNLKPEELDSNNPLHEFFRHTPDIMELSNLDDRNEKLQQYLMESYLYWIEQGADAFRIDTIKHVPHEFWKLMADKIRAEHPDFFMFGESFDYNANFLAQHTLLKNGGISVLDFVGKQAIVATFENPQSDYADLQEYLHLTHGPYANPYELTTFYDNHDMPRMNASDHGFIDANNWLFTSRGIPVVYQGSEIGFMRGKAEHQGNRNYFGQSNIEEAKTHKIHQALTKIANIRKNIAALQNGLQVNVELHVNKAAFYRVLVKDGKSQTALVLLNKGDQEAEFLIQKYMQSGSWVSQINDDKVSITESHLELKTNVVAHGVQVWLRQGPISNPLLLDELQRLMLNK
ncbi:alpha-amylase family glycosyl hydrolase [Paraglaciecola psychrophila]|uniref:Alpha amylase catalytic subunit n=1 Tax=Paraglaciecola psychrophila 170 TaxID=1129794 RepID=K7ALY8_9ALTE|nr:alpha-amylase family glycosyl hydrolase [Paraglaciecola psychrophila]AGH45069.1 alpha amylase catalytic subunit [Paraglaciecola psychrophila 170]GAC36410.1 cyclomaltodextrin glucanotransferase [Paraglaciecola psychrophila 170]